MFSGGMIKLYQNNDSIYGYTLRDLVKIWYKSALAVPDEVNPLSDDDLDGTKVIVVPLGKTGKKMLVAGGAWEKQAIKRMPKNGGPGNVFLRHITIDTDTVIFAPMINVILEPGAHHIKPPLENAYYEAQSVMKEEKVDVRLKIIGPIENDGRPNGGWFFTSKELLYVSTTLDDPETDLDQDGGLHIDPEGTPELRIRPENPQHHAGWYACFELGVGNYTINIDGRAPLHGGQEHGIEFLMMSSQYDLTVK